MSKRKFKTTILIIVTILYMSFIWFHSFMSGEDSTKESSFVMNLINNFFDKIGVSYQFGELMIRKAAHFLEFTLLGLFVMWTSCYINNKTLKNYLSCSFICLATATIDERIQYFTPDRFSSVGDVILDYSGAVFGFLVISLIIFLQRKAKKR